jgi:hypothetical protein
VAFGKTGVVVSEKKRKVLTGEFKAKVALEAVRNIKTVNAIAQEFGVHPRQVGQWKKELQEQAAGLFEIKRRVGADGPLALARQCGLAGVGRPNPVWGTDITYIRLARGFRVLGGGDRRVQAQGAGLAGLEHAGQRVLRRLLGASLADPWHP